jgi:hypothetical protein
MRGAIPPLAQYAFMAWYLVKHRENFSLSQKWKYGSHRRKSCRNNLAESLTVLQTEICLMIMVNINNRKVNIYSLTVKMGCCEMVPHIQALLAQRGYIKENEEEFVSSEKWLEQNLKDTEMRSIIRTCQDYSECFHLADPTTCHKYRNTRYISSCRLLKESFQTL